VTRSTRRARSRPGRPVLAHRRRECRRDRRHHAVDVATPVPSAINVNMLRLRFTTEPSRAGTRASPPRAPPGREEQLEPWQPRSETVLHGHPGSRSDMRAGTPEPSREAEPEPAAHFGQLGVLLAGGYRARFEAMPQIDTTLALSARSPDAWQVHSMGPRRGLAHGSGLLFPRLEILAGSLWNFARQPRLQNRTRGLRGSAFLLGSSRSTVMPQTGPCRDAQRGQRASHAAHVRVADRSSPAATHEEERATGVRVP